MLKQRKELKDKVQGTIAKLKMECAKQLAKLATHVVNIECQYRTCHLRKRQMSHEELWLHTDCRELDNEELWPSSVITSRFGASNSQVT